MASPLASSTAKPSRVTSSAATRSPSAPASCPAKSRMDLSCPAPRRVTPLTPRDRLRSKVKCPSGMVTVLPGSADKSASRSAWAGSFAGSGAPPQALSSAAPNAPTSHRCVAFIVLSPARRIPSQKTQLSGLARSGQGLSSSACAFSQLRKATRSSERRFSTQPRIAASSMKPRARIGSGIKSRGMSQ